MWAYLPENRITAKEALKHPFFDDIKDIKNKFQGKKWG